MIDSRDEVPELDEANNVIGTEAPILIRGPDLAAVTADGGSFAFRGLPYPLAVVIENLGGATARDFRLCILLSDNPLISVATDTELFRTARLSLAPGGRRTLELVVELPVGTADGAWHIAAVVDCTGMVDEISENNNIRRRSSPIVVRDPAPDLVVRDVRTATIGVAGERMPFAFSLANTGHVASAAGVCARVSDNPGVTAWDPAVFVSPLVWTLERAEERPASGWARIPADLPSGMYYLGLTVDPEDQVEEIDEGNNHAP